MLLKTYPASRFNGAMRVPSSKPETQRAIFIAAQANGVSRVYNDLRCLETDTMKKACRSIGAQIIEHDDHLEIHGVGNNIAFPSNVIDAKGSGLVFRIFTALASTIKFPVIITGEDTLRRRVQEPLFNALAQLNVRIECIAEPGMVPVVNWSESFDGGKCVIPGNISSQFITAILLVAPRGKKATEIVVEGEVLSISYIRQTVHAMRHAGIHVEHADDFSWLKVEPGNYQPIDSHITGDYTSASYLLARAALFPGVTVLGNMHEDSLQGERFILNVLRALGMTITFDEKNKSLTVHNEEGIKAGDYEFNAVDFPNIVPTLAAIGAFVPGRFRVTGGSITRLHKAPRVQAMIAELNKLGVAITPLFVGEAYDGFEIHGKTTYSGGIDFSSWGDHRIFMSLFVVSLKTQQPNYLDGFADVICSFPDFFSEFIKDGARFEVVNRKNKVEVIRIDNIECLQCLA